MLRTPLKFYYKIDSQGAKKKLQSADKQPKIFDRKMQKIRQSYDQIYLLHENFQTSSCTRKTKSMSWLGRERSIIIIYGHVVNTYSCPENVEEGPRE